jgi:hypothetical protein
VVPTNQKAREKGAEDDLYLLEARLVICFLYPVVELVRSKSFDAADIAGSRGTRFSTALRKEGGGLSIIQATEQQRS